MKSEPIGEWVKKQGMVNIRYGDAIELIQELRIRRENIGLEFGEWVDWAEEVIGMVCDIFDIKEEEVGRNARRKHKKG